MDSNLKKRSLESENTVEKKVRVSVPVKYWGNVNPYPRPYTKKVASVLESVKYGELEMGVLNNMLGMGHSAIMDMKGNFSTVLDDTVDKYKKNMSKDKDDDFSSYIDAMDMSNVVIDLSEFENKEPVTSPKSADE
jgi:hypothetical protein